MNERNKKYKNQNVWELSRRTPLFCLLLYSDASSDEDDEEENFSYSSQSRVPSNKRGFHKTECEFVVAVMTRSLGAFVR